MVFSKTDGLSSTCHGFELLCMLELLMSIKAFCEILKGKKNELLLIILIIRDVPADKECDVKWKQCNLQSAVSKSL